MHTTKFQPYLPTQAIYKSPKSQEKTQRKNYYYSETTISDGVYQKLIIHATRNDFVRNFRSISGCLETGGFFFFLLPEEMGV